MKRYSVSKSASHGIAVGILLLGAVLRLAAFDETLINSDQSAILDAAFQVARLKYFPIIGMKSSVGVMQTGVVPLLAAVPLFFVKRSIAVQWFFSALDWLALAWLYRATRDTLGRRTASITALLYATSPWVVLYARTIWYQTLVAALATTAFAAILVLGKQNKPKSGVLILAMVSATLMSMVHLVAAPWGVVLFVLCGVIGWRRRWWWPLVAGLGASLAVTLPYLMHLVRSSFDEIAFLLHTAGEGAGLNTAAFRLSRELLSGMGIIANAHGDLWDRSIIPWDTAPALLSALLGMALVWAIVRVITDRRDRPWLLFTLVWLFAVPTLFLFSDVHLQHFYLMTLFPAPFVLLGAWIAGTTGCSVSRMPPLLARLGGIVGRLATALLVLIALWWASLWLVRIRLEAQGQLERPTRGWLLDRAAATAAQYLRDEPEGQVIVLARFGGEMSPFEWLRGYAQTDAVRVVDTDQGMVIPAGPTCYLLGPEVSVDVLSPVASAVTEVPGMAIPANPPWRFYCKAASVESSLPLAQWENGLSLLGTSITGEWRAGGHLKIVHTWDYRAVKPGPYHFFNHLLLDGTLVAQVDGGSVPHWYWHDGDTLLTYFTLDLPADLPPGNYVLRVGMYTWPDIVRVLMVTGEDGYVLTIPQE
ncbi:MAG TPA: hypothetical protein PLH19_01640 [Anaerolineae bacterium]|nr:hypothetical protein [Anaerolineae bacterium]HQH37226.1 hypothetical protein [Anaerolineae bacterium]